FQAEDGIRDATVTGVQTCALPISPRREGGTWSTRGSTSSDCVGMDLIVPRSSKRVRQRFTNGVVKAGLWRPSYRVRARLHMKKRSEERRVGQPPTPPPPPAPPTRA